VARYREIADELAAQIASGQLGPGDRVPSARRIVRDYEVAVATATKALAALQSAGLTEVIAGVGTVVAARPVVARPAGAARPVGAARAAARTDDSGLSRAAITQAAVAIADAEGLAQLTMRRVATELGVATMSLYRHVDGKDELVNAMTEAVWSEARLPASQPPELRAALEVSARLLWQSFRRHAWLPTAISITRPELIVSGMRHTEWVLTALDGRGLSPQQTLQIHTSLFSFMRGLALNVEMEAQAVQDTGLTSDEWMEAQADQFDAITAGGEFPRLAELARSDIEPDLDALFEFGLALMLDGLERYLER
jgi:AcrR family transcriptional regulator